MVHKRIELSKVHQPRTGWTLPNFASLHTRCLLATTSQPGCKPHCFAKDSNCNEGFDTGSACVAGRVACSCAWSKVPEIWCNSAVVCHFTLCNVNKILDLPEKKELPLQSSIVKHSCNEVKPRMNLNKASHHKDIAIFKSQTMIYKSTLLVNVQKTWTVLRHAKKAGKQESTSKKKNGCHGKLDILPLSHRSAASDAAL